MSCTERENFLGPVWEETEEETEREVHWIISLGFVLYTIYQPIQLSHCRFFVNVFFQSVCFDSLYRLHSRDRTEQGHDAPAARHSILMGEESTDPSRLLICYDVVVGPLTSFDSTDMCSSLDGRPAPKTVDHSTRIASDSRCPLIYWLWMCLARVS